MSLTLPPGHHLLRWTALTPANCGDTGGSAAIDRPVAVDAWTGLPYLPHSALKGVLAGRRGNVHLPGGALNRHRTGVFGAPDVDDQGTGSAGAVVFGDGDPLAFPVLLRDGRRALVAVADTLWRLARLGYLPAAGLRRVERRDACDGPVPLAALPPLRERPSRDRFEIDPGALAQLLGSPTAPVVVAARDAARALWQAAVEERTLTAIDAGGTVLAGSLRTIELIPAGALFVALVSNLAGEPVDLGDAAPIQLGAWESTGCGYFHAALVEPPGEEGAGGAGGPETRGVAPPLGEDTERRPSLRHDVMRAVHVAMKDLAPRKEAPRARSAIYDLGPRLARHGLPATLAFCLAKARVEETAEADERIGEERAAYRWILRQLFAAEGLPAADLHARVVAAIREGEAALPPDFDETRLWLRRYAETMETREKTDG